MEILEICPLASDTIVPRCEGPKYMTRTVISAVQAPYPHPDGLFTKRNVPSACFVSAHVRVSHQLTDLRHTPPQFTDQARVYCNEKPTGVFFWMNSDSNTWIGSRSNASYVICCDVSSCQLLVEPTGLHGTR